MTIAPNAPPPLSTTATFLRDEMLSPIAGFATTDNATNSVNNDNKNLLILEISFLRSNVAHVYLFNIIASLTIDLNTDKIVARFRTVALAHGVECQVIDIVEESLVPLVNMTAEDCTGIPLFKLIEQEVGLLAGESGGELHA